MSPLTPALVLTLAAYSAPRVVGGHPAPDGRYPDAASIWYGNSVGCTGTLIAPDLVLTAGHCIGGITAAEVNSTDYWTYDGEYIEVTSQHEYPNSWNSIDVGVLVLAQPATAAAPRVIARDCIANDYLVDGADVAIVGFGATDIWGNDYDSILNEAFSTITDHDGSELQRGFNPSVSPGGELGAGGSGIDACFGDSGGPLYLLTPEGTFLAGATSRSYQDVYAPCEEGGIYGRADAIVAWVESTTGRTLPTPDCGGSGGGTGSTDPGDADPGDGGPAGDDGPGDDPGLPDDNGHDEDAPPTDTPGAQAPDPRAEGIVVMQGTRGSTAIDVRDPDPGDSHGFAIVFEPLGGSASVLEDGTVIFDADPGYSGPDMLIVRVTDSTGLSDTVDVNVQVLRDAGCGCTSGPTTTAPWMGLVGLLALLGRRRR